MSLLLFAPGATLAAGVYYVDPASPACSDAGPGTEAQPYCTISAAAAAHNGPGVTLYVKPGIYREQVTVPASGAAGSPFMFQALGGPVVVDGSDSFSSPSQWVPSSAGVYRAASVTWNPQQVFMDGARLMPWSAAPDSLPGSSFTWVSGQGLYVNAGGGNPGVHQLLVGHRNYGFSVFGRSWVTVAGFEIVRTADIGINIGSGCAELVISNNRVSFANSYGIRCNNSVKVLIEDNRVSDCNYHGIGLTAGSNGCIVRGNESFRNADPALRRANGIHLYSATGNTLAGNRLHDNQDTGLHLAGGSNGCVSYNNRSWNNGDHGFDHLAASGTIHTNDVAFGNYNDGFSIEGNSTNTRISNCIAIENGLTTNGSDLLVDASSSAGFVSDYNILWNSTSQQPIKYIATRYATLAGYQAASGQDPHSLQADPRFVDGGAGNFHPMAGSPAVDAADSGVPNWPSTDAEGNVRVDTPAIPNTGVGPVRYSDRGALEFQADRAPIVTAPATATVAEHESLTVNVTAADPDGDAIELLTAAGLPPGATFTVGPGDTSGTLTWVPTTGDVGPHAVTITATNLLSGTDTTVIMVTASTTGVPVESLSGKPFPPRVVPNPVRGQGQLRFALARDGAVRVQLFDLTGRAVRNLMEEADAKAGEYQLSLEVGSGSGGSLPPGLYFYRIQTAQGTARGRFMVLR